MAKKSSPEEERELLHLVEQESRSQARESHLQFIKHCWRKTATDPFIEGFHTRKICERIDQAFADFRNGESTYLLINVHHRSGKSDIVSRYLGSHFLGEFPSHEVMQVTYQANLSTSFSAFGRNVFRSDKFRELYPNISLSRETNKKNEWVIMGHDGRETGGRLYASGLQSGLTGSGFSLGILDDYFAGRSEAESRVQRDNAWAAFTDDFMTRAAPVSIVIVLATQWHWDDVSGRIRQEAKDNENFPQFEELVFPARANDYRGEGEYSGKYLFTERYGEEWYERQYATLGPYSAAALLDCNPYMRTGGVLSTDGIVYHSDVRHEFPSDTGVSWWRIWDLAHTARQRQNDDPDWTSGTKLAFETKPGDPVPHLWVRDVKRIRAGAAERDRFMQGIASMDGKFVRQGIENSIDSKDAWEYITAAVPDVSWNKIQTHGDKLVRAAPLEAIFAAPGHVHVLRAEWNEEWIEEVIRFDGLGTTHDDQVDNLSAGYQVCVSQGYILDKDIREQMKARRKR